METKNGFFIKDLRIISNKKLKDMIIVDNLAHSFGFQIENGVPILEWYSDQNDVELKYLCEYLSEAAKYEDVRIFNTEKLKLFELIDYNLEW
jgi:CTD small phosphatase-like protein 2